jgi:hypothetical protein
VPDMVPGLSQCGGCLADMCLDGVPDINGAWTECRSAACRMLGGADEAPLELSRSCLVHSRRTCLAWYQAAAAFLGQATVCDCDGCSNGLAVRSNRAPDYKQYYSFTCMQLNAHVVLRACICTC